MSIFVRLWGVRGSIPTPGHRTSRYGGNTPCVEVRVGDTRFICDGGTGIRGLGSELMKTVHETPVRVHMLFSHAHWDHIQGFPFFQPAYVPTTRVTVYGAREGDAYQTGPTCFAPCPSGRAALRYRKAARPLRRRPSYVELR